MNYLLLTNRLGLWSTLCVIAFLPGVSPARISADEPAKQATERWQRIPFKTTDKGWQLSEFGGDGKVAWNDATVTIVAGQPMTGIRYVGEFPKDGYEIRFDARRVEGSDFFVGLTFPIAEDHCSLILGGWSGTISGLSTLHGSDASENATSFFQNYQQGQWYRIRLSVGKERIKAWIDDEEVIDCEREGNRFGVRIEVDPSLPLGLATYMTEAEIKNFEFRKL